MNKLYKVTITFPVGAEIREVHEVVYMAEEEVDKLRDAFIKDCLLAKPEEVSKYKFELIEIPEP